MVHLQVVARVACAFALVLIHFYYCLRQDPCCNLFVAIGIGESELCPAGLISPGQQACRRLAPKVRPTTDGRPASYCGEAVQVFSQPLPSALCVYQSLNNCVLWIQPVTGRNATVAFVATQHICMPAQTVEISGESCILQDVFAEDCTTLPSRDPPYIVSKPDNDDARVTFPLVLGYVAVALVSMVFVSKLALLFISRRRARLRRTPTAARAEACELGAEAFNPTVDGSTATVDGDLQDARDNTARALAALRARRLRANPGEVRSVVEAPPPAYDDLAGLPAYEAAAGTLAQLPPADWASAPLVEPLAAPTSSLARYGTSTESPLGDAGARVLPAVSDTSLLSDAAPSPATADSSVLTAPTCGRRQSSLTQALQYATADRGEYLQIDHEGNGDSSQV